VHRASAGRRLEVPSVEVGSGVALGGARLGGVRFETLDWFTGNPEGIP
jgi:hypothetical protein